MRQKYFVPLLWILTVVGIISGLQSFFFIYRGEKNISEFLLSLFISLVYSWYYLGLSAFLYYIIPLQFQENSSRYVKLFHLPALFVNALLHQSLLGFMQNTLLGASVDLSPSGILLKTTNAWIDGFVYLIFLLVMYSLEYKKNVLEQAMKISEAQMNLSKSVLSEMRNRLHPDFFFYSLNSIQSAVQQDKFREADKIMSSLSTFLRGTVYGSQDVEVELHEELSLLESYLETRALCSGSQGVYSISCPVELKDALILNRQIFSLAEDIFRDDLKLMIRNDGGILVTEMTGKVACDYTATITLVKKYLQEYYGSRSDVAAVENEGVLRIEMRLPLNFKNQLGV